MSAIGQPTGTPAQGQSTHATPAFVELADDPFTLEAVGLTIMVPTGSTVQSARGSAGSAGSAQIADDAGRWLINIQTPPASGPKSTITSAADQTIALIQGSVGVLDPTQTRVLSTEAQLISRKRVQVGTQTGERVYLSVPGTGGSDRVVKGYTIFKPLPGQFVVFELVTTQSLFDRVRGVYELAVGTATFADPAALAQPRAAAVQSGLALMGRFGPTDWARILDGVERWQRLSVDAPSGSPSDAQELGYRSIRLWIGQRGEVDSDRPREGWSVVERQEGYLARVRVRLLDGPDRLIDTEATYFTTPDRSEEAWGIRTYARSLAGKTLGVWRETGARFGSDMTVQIVEPGRPSRTVRPLIQGDGYLGAVEALALPGVLIAGQVEGEYGFYTYRTQGETISLRRDRLAKLGPDLPDQSSTAAPQNSGPARPAGWSITTTFREGEPPQVATYNADGELVRADLGQGRSWRPIEFEDLLTLWSRKGLPTNTEPQAERRRERGRRNRDERRDSPR